MTRTRSLFSPIPALLMLGILLLAACSSPPIAKLPAESPSPPSLEQFQIQFEGGFSLDYQVKRTISQSNQRSCFAFITGTLHNRSQQTLSKQSVLDFIVMNQGTQLFRDITNPVSHIAPSGQAAFVMVVSPVHRDGCPTYDKINVSLRKVFLN